MAYAKMIGRYTTFTPMNTEVHHMYMRIRIGPHILRNMKLCEQRKTFCFCRALFKCPEMAKTPAVDVRVSHFFRFFLENKRGSPAVRTRRRRRAGKGNVFQRPPGEGKTCAHFGFGYSHAQNRAHAQTRARGEGGCPLEGHIKMAESKTCIHKKRNGRVQYLVFR